MRIIKSGFALLGMLLSMPVLAEGGIDTRIDEAVKPFADAVAGVIFSSFPLAGIQFPFVLVWLIVGSNHIHVLFPFHQSCAR